MGRNWLTRSLPWLGLLLLGLACWLLLQQLQGVNWHKVLLEMRSTQPLRLGVACLCTLAGYAVVLGYDLMGLRYVRRKLPLGKLLLASYVSGAFSNSLSLPVIGVGGMRIRFYRNWGFSGLELTKMIAFEGIAGWLGLLTLGGIACVLRPPHLSFVPDWSLRFLGALLLAVILGYLLLCWKTQQLRLGKRILELPDPQTALAQTVLGSCEWLAQALLLFTLMSQSHQVELGWMLPSFLAAMFAALIVHSPAGLGVFDAAILLFFTPPMHREALLGALTLFRLSYHFLPLLLAVLLLAVFEISERWRRQRRLEGEGERAPS